MTKTHLFFCQTPTKASTSNYVQLLKRSVNAKLCILYSCVHIWNFFKKKRKKKEQEERTQSCQTVSLTHTCAHPPARRQARTRTDILSPSLSDTRARTHTHCPDAKSENKRQKIKNVKPFYSAGIQEHHTKHFTVFVHNSRLVIWYSHAMCHCCFQHCLNSLST